MSDTCPVTCGVTHITDVPLSSSWPITTGVMFLNDALLTELELYQSIAGNAYDVNTAFAIVADYSAFMWVGCRNESIS